MEPYRVPPPREALPGQSQGAQRDHVRLEQAVIYGLMLVALIVAAFSQIKIP